MCMLQMSLLFTEPCQGIFRAFAELDENKIKEIFKREHEDDVEVSERPLISHRNKYVLLNERVLYFDLCIKFQSYNCSPSKWFSEATYKIQSKIWMVYGSAVKFGDFNQCIRFFVWIYDHFDANKFEDLFESHPKYQEINTSFTVDNEIKFFMGLDYEHKISLIQEFRAWETIQS